MKNFEVFGIPSLKKGSGIHIKEENRGKFTDYCGGKVTDECIQRGKNSSNPITRKRATFADNAKRWKHQQGGLITKFQNPAGPIGVSNLTMSPIVDKEDLKPSNIPIYIPEMPIMVNPNSKDKDQQIKHIYTNNFSPIQKGKQFVINWFNNATSKNLYYKHEQERLADKKEETKEKDYLSTLDYPQKSRYLTLKANYDHLSEKELAELQQYEHDKQWYTSTYDEDPYFKTSKQQTDQYLNNQTKALSEVPYGYTNGVVGEYRYPGNQNPNDYQKTWNYVQGRYKSNDKLNGLATFYNPNDIRQYQNTISYRSKHHANQAIAHEESHQMELKGVAHALAKYLKSKLGITVDGDEAMSWLMTDRASNNMDPDDRKWDAERINGIYDNTKKQDGLIRRLELRNIPREKIIEAVEYIYNNISKNDQLDTETPEQLYRFDPNSEVSFAKKGNKLIHKPNGHRSILDNDWIPTKELKKKHKLVSYNKGGGTAENNIDEKIKKVQIMHFLQQHQNNDTSDLIKYDAYRSNNIENYILNNDYPDIAQDTYLFSPEDRHNAFINQGWIKLENPDYGLVSKGVGNRNLPMYQKNKDEADRKDLFVLSNESSNFQINDKDLYHAGYAPSVYYGNNKGEIYYKKYDLHDYGQDEQKNRGARYGFLRNKFVNYLDKIGNPTVLSTGIIKINPDELDYSALSDKTAASIFNYLYNKDYTTVKKAYNQFLYNTGYSSEEYSFVDYINNIMNQNDEE